MCAVAGCGRKCLARGLCNAHYDRQRRGVPLDGPIRQRGESKPSAPAPVASKADPAFRVWKRQIIAPIVAHPRGSTEYNAALLAVAREMHTTPSGKTRRIDVGTLRTWINQARATTTGDSNG